MARTKSKAETSIRTNFAACFGSTFTMNEFLDRFTYKTYVNLMITTLLRNNSFLTSKSFRCRGTPTRTKCVLLRTGKSLSPTRCVSIALLVFLNGVVNRLVCPNGFTVGFLRSVCVLFWMYQPPALDRCCFFEKEDRVPYCVGAGSEFCFPSSIVNSNWLPNCS